MHPRIRGYRVLQVQEPKRWTASSNGSKNIGLHVDPHIAIRSKKDEGISFFGEEPSQKSVTVPFGTSDEAPVTEVSKLLY